MVFYKIFVDRRGRCGIIRVRLDVFAVDGLGKRYNIEVQRRDEGATAKRARYNSSVKEKTEGVHTMCRIMEEALAEREKKKAIEIATRMLHKKIYPISDIVDMTKIPLSEVEQLAKSINA
ncbi:MAG: hypothetical protein IJ493_11765 [Clostridia bacterium]|nr:hypothetical protein [Clostridia bacterium]